MSVDTLLRAVANAIRAKTNTTEAMTLEQMPALIYSISGSGDEPGNPGGNFVTTSTDNITINRDENYSYWQTDEGDTTGLDNSWYIDTGYISVTEIQNDGVIYWMEHTEYVEISALKAGTAILEVGYTPEIWRSIDDEFERPKGTYGSVVTLTIEVLGSGESYSYKTDVNLYVGDTTSDEYMVGCPYETSTVGENDYTLIGDAARVITENTEWVNFTGVKVGTATCTFTYTSYNPNTDEEVPCTHVFNITVTEKPQQKGVMFPLSYNTATMNTYIGMKGTNGSLLFTDKFDTWGTYGGTRTFNGIEFNTNGDIRYYLTTNPSDGYIVVGKWNNTSAYYDEAVRTILVYGEPSAALLNFINLFAENYNLTTTTEKIGAEVIPYSWPINCAVTGATYEFTGTERFTPIINDGVVEIINQPGLMKSTFKTLKAGTAQFYVEEDSTYTTSSGTYPFINKYLRTVTVEGEDSGDTDTANYGVWTFRNDIDADELRDYISARGTGDYLNHVGFDIRFDVPGGAECTIEADEGAEHTLYQFKRMEFHYNDEEGDAIIYHSAQGNDYGYVGSGTDLSCSRTIVLREQPSAELLTFLQLFFEQEYSSIFTIQLNDYPDYLEGIMIGLAAEEWTWEELAASGDEPSIILDEGYSDANFPDGWMMLETNSNTYHIQVQPSDVIMDGAVYEAMYY